MRKIASALSDTKPLKKKLNLRHAVQIPHPKHKPYGQMPGVCREMLRLRFGRRIRFLATNTRDI